MNFGRKVETVRACRGIYRLSLVGGRVPRTVAMFGRSGEISRSVGGRSGPARVGTLRCSDLVLFSASKGKTDAVKFCEIAERGGNHFARETDGDRPLQMPRKCPKRRGFVAEPLSRENNLRLRIYRAVGKVLTVFKTDIVPKVLTVFKTDAVPELCFEN